MGISEVPKGIKNRFNIIFWGLVILQIGAIILCETQFKEKSEIDEFLYYPILGASFISFIISIVFRILSRNQNLMKKWSEFPLKNFKSLHEKRREKLNMSESDYKTLITSDQVLVVTMISWVFAEKITVLAIVLSLLFGVSKVTIGMIFFSILLNLFNRPNWDYVNDFLKKVMKKEDE